MGKSNLEPVEAGSLALHGVGMGKVSMESL